MSKIINSEEFKKEVNKLRPDYLREIQFNTYSLLDRNFENYYLRIFFKWII